MRGLAEFIMRGRWQALGIAVLGSGSLLFGWISAAAIALVTLRRGTTSGGWLVLWALLPAVVLTAMTGDTGSVMLLRITKPVKKIRIADRLPRLLNNIDALGKRQYSINWWEVTIPTKLPYVLTRQIHTSKHTV
jgi:hypothetical protein